MIDPKENYLEKLIKFIKQRRSLIILTLLFFTVYFAIPFKNLECENYLITFLKSFYFRNFWTWKILMTLMVLREMNLELE